MSIEPLLFLILFALALSLAVFLLYKLVTNQTNQLEWDDLVATNKRLNAYKCGYWIGIGIGSWAVIKTTYLGELDPLVFAAYLTFCGGVPVAAGAIGSRKDARRRDIDDPDK